MDVQSVGGAIAAVLVAIGGIVGGIYTGRSNRKKDENQARLDFEKSKLERDTAEETISRLRYEELYRENGELRRTLRADAEEYEKRIRKSRKDGQRGWDLARWHYGLLGLVVDILRHLLMLTESPSKDTQFYRKALLDSRKRFEMISIPPSLEAPIPAEDT